MTRGEWIEKCAECYRKAGVDREFSRIVAEATAGVEEDEHGEDIEKWLDPSEAAEADLECWND